MEPSISIIIPTYKRHALLKKLLESLTGHTPSGAEIIVVDQSPDAPSLSADLGREYPFITNLYLPKPSLPRARNAGIAHSKGSIILFLDDDAVIEPRCVFEHLSLHARTDIHVVAGRIRQMNNASWAPIDTVATVNSQTGETAGNFDLNYEGGVIYATGGHLSIKRSVFTKTGLFNPRFTGNALFEDIEFSFRVRKHGFTIWYTPRALIYHYPAAEGGCHSQNQKQYLMDRLHNHTLFYILHFNSIPRKYFIVYIRHLIEFIARKNIKRHSIITILMCFLAVCKAYGDACASVLFNPKLASQ